MTVHPLAQVGAAAVIAEILAHTGDKGSVVRREIGDGLFIHKYKDKLRINGVDRLARGVILDGDGRPVTLPIPKFDEAASFSPDASEYYKRIEERLSSYDALRVQPKHDGTSIIAVFEKNEMIVSTFLSRDNSQAMHAASLLHGKKWKDGQTLQMELIWKDDAKLQTKRVADGLYLFYGCDSDGRELDRDELTTIARELSISIVKEQTLSVKKIMLLLRRMDEIDERAQLQEGVVVILPDRTRLKIKSWQYLNAAGHPVIDRAWLLRLIRKTKSVEELHTHCETLDGVLNDRSQSLSLLVAELGAVRTWMDEIERYPFATPDEIKSAPRAMQPILFKRAQAADFWETDAGLMDVIRMHCSAYP